MLLVLVRGRRGRPATGRRCARTWSACAFRCDACRPRIGAEVRAVSSPLPSSLEQSCQVPPSVSAVSSSSSARCSSCSLRIRSSSCASISGVSSTPVSSAAISAMAATCSCSCSSSARCSTSSAHYSSLWMSMRQLVSFAANRTFWPSLPMASDSWCSGTTASARCSRSLRWTETTLAGCNALAT